MKKNLPFFICILRFILSLYILKAQQPRLMLPVGHLAEVNSASFSPDGKWIVTSSNDGTAKVWDATSGQLIADLLGHTDKIVNSASFSPDGKWVVTAGDDHTARVWEAATGRLTVNLTGHMGEVKSAVFSPDGKSVLTASGDSTARVWNAASGQLEADLKGHTGTVESAVFSRDGKSIVTASGDSTARVWNAFTGELIAELRGHTDQVNSATFSPDGKYIVTASEDNLAKVWDALTGQLITTLKGHNNHVRSAAFSPDGKWIVTASNYETAEVWNASTGKLLTGLKRSNVIVNSVAFSPDGKLIVTALTDSTAKVWNVATRQLVADLKGHTYLVHGERFSPDGKLIATASNKTAKVWDAVTGKLIADLKGHTSYIWGEVFSPDGKLIVTFTLDTSKVWNAATGQLIANLEGRATNFSPDGKWVVTASKNNTAKVWSAATGQLISALSGHIDDVSTAVFSPDGKSILTSSADSTGKVWNAANGKLIADCRGHTNYVTSGAFSPDGKLIVTTSGDRTAKVWNAATGQIIADLKGHTADVENAVFSPDGGLIVTTALDSIPRIWNTTTGQLIADLKGHTSEVYSTSFSPDGKWIVTCSRDHTARIWKATNGSLVKVLQGDNNENFGSIDFVNNRITSINNSEINTYDLETGRKLYSSLAIDSTDYLNHIPSGYYKCTPNAAKLLHYVTKDAKVITFAQLDIKYNRPDKVLEAMDYPDTALINSYRNIYYKRIKKLGIDTTEFREGYSVPEADFVNRDSINSDQTNEILKLHIRGKDSAYPLNRFNVWINDVPLFGVRGIAVKRQSSNIFDTALTIILSQGANQIETSVISVNGTESYRMPLLVKYSPAQPKKEKVYFIGIGINHFADNNYNLQWSVKDIRDLSLKLKEKYKNDIEIDTLFDQNVAIAKVTALKKKLEKSSINDKVILAYSGHGLLSDAYDYYLSTYSVNFNHPEQNGLPYDELDNLLDSIPARKKMMLIDACHSGEVDKEEMQQYMQAKSKLDSMGIQKGVLLINKDRSKTGVKSSVELMQELFVNVGKSTGATIISAAAGTQFALEKNNLKNGVFTYSLLEYMQQHKHATVNELKQYVNKRVTELTAGMQVPTTRNENTELNWEVW